MAKKAFCSTLVPNFQGENIIVAVDNLVVLDNNNNLVLVNGSPILSVQVELSYSSTLGSLQSAIVDAIRDAHSDQGITVIFLDNIGLL